MKLVSFDITEDEMSSTNSRQVKSIVKKCVKSTAFNELKEIQSQHIKVKEIVYTTFTMKP